MEPAARQANLGDCRTGRPIAIMVGTGGVIVAPSNAGRENVRTVGFGAEPTFVGHAQIDCCRPTAVFAASSAGPNRLS